jgi:NADPH-dependent 2,4-dienoyl-CoA reductase/sulfur reductase-like enzyme
MVTRESCLPYDRTQLSKGYLKSDESAPPTIRSQDFYTQRDIEVLLDHEVVNVDAANKDIIFRDGSSLKYDKLLLATGGTPRCLTVPGVSLKNILMLRNLDDATRLRAVAEKGSKAVVIGASFIGLETAATLTERGLSVTVVAIESVPFEQILGVEIGEMYRALHEGNGVSFQLGTTVERFDGNAEVKKTVLKNGEMLDTDLVLMGIGVQPATDFLKCVDLDTDGSIKVDKHLHAGNDIYAAGDIASFIDWRTGGRIRIEHWRLAGEHGRIAARNMLGKEMEYLSIPFFWTDQFGFSLRYAGYVKGWDEIIFRGKPSTRNFAAFYAKDDQVLAAAGGGNVVKMAAVAEVMRRGLMPSPDQLRDGNIDLEKLIKKR